MSDDPGPFANWPHIDAPGKSRPDGARLIEPETPTTVEDAQMANNNQLESFLGGSPANVFVRLFFISLVVGALLMWLEIHPIDILRGVQAFFQRIYDLGFGAIREVASYVLAGAVIVVPAWLLLRLLNFGGRR